MSNTYSMFLIKILLRNRGSYVLLDKICIKNRQSTYNKNRNS